MFISYDEFRANLAAVRAQIDGACRAAGRDAGTVSLLPVTKNHPPEAARYAVRAGIPAVGENRVQEARDKQLAAQEPELRWELIGHLQSNKARLAASIFQRIQSVDNARLATLLDRAAAERGAVLAVLLQVNAGNDPAKFGCDLSDAPRLLEHVLTCRHLQLDRLMAIAPLSDAPSVADETFANLRELRDRLASSFKVPLSELSMGMSGDLESAIKAGSTQVRVGTALFGARERSI